MADVNTQLTGGFFDSTGGVPTYSAEDFSRYLEGLVGNGCLPLDSALAFSSNGFFVSTNPADVNGDNMSVTIGPGKAYYNGLWAYNPTSAIYTVPTTSGDPAKFFLIYLTFDVVNRVVSVAATTASLTPVLPANVAGQYYYQALAKIKNGVATRLSALTTPITDMRGLKAGVTPMNTVDIANLTTAVINQLVPAGMIAYYTRSTLPNAGWLHCNGSVYSPSTYPALFAAIGSVYGGDAVNPKLPDLQGLFLRGAGTHGTMTDAIGATVSTTQGDQFASHTHDLLFPYVAWTGYQVKLTTAAITSGTSNYSAFIASANPAATDDNYVPKEGAALATGATGETRPNNMSLLPCIKAH